MFSVSTYCNIALIYEKYYYNNNDTFSPSLNELFTDQSVNSPAFMMAILKEKGIVVTLKDKSRSYEHVDYKRCQP